MKWLTLQFGGKNNSWILGAVLALALAGCNNPSPGVPGLPAQREGLDIRVVAGAVQVGDAASGQIAGAGQTVLITKGMQLRTSDSDGAELVLAGTSRLSLAPRAVIELTEFEADTSFAFRQMNGAVTFDMDTLDLTITGSTGLAFGPDGLERVEFLVEPLAEDSLFVIDVNNKAIMVTVEEGVTAVDIGDQAYEIYPGESLSVEGLDKVEVGAALTPQPEVPLLIGGAETDYQAPLSVRQSAMAAPAEIPLSGAEAVAPQLASPPDNARLSGADVINLVWQSEAIPEGDLWFEVQVWRASEPADAIVTVTQKTEWQPSTGLGAGRYEWQVRMIRLSDRQYVGPPSAIGHFQVIQPATATATATSSPTPFPTSTPTSSPTIAPTSAPTVSATETPTLVVGQASYPQPVLIAPDTEKVFAAEEPVVLRWQPVGALGYNQRYEVRLFRNGTEWAGAVKVGESEWAVTPDYNPGRYAWRVAVITVEGGEWTADISPESEIRFFTWNPPPAADGGGGDDGGESGPPSSR